MDISFGQSPKIQITSSSFPQINYPIRVELPIYFNTPRRLAAPLG